MIGVLGRVEHRMSTVTISLKSKATTGDATLWGRGLQLLLHVLQTMCSAARITFSYVLVGPSDLQVSDKLSVGRMPKILVNPLRQACNCWVNLPLEADGFSSNW